MLILRSVALSVDFEVCGSYFEVCGFSVLNMLLAPTQSADNLCHFFTILCENENFPISN